MLINRRFQLFVSPGDVPVFSRFTRFVFLSGRQESCELRLVNNGESLAEVRLEGIRIDSEEGERPLFRVVLVDITEQKQVERNLRERRDRYQALVQASPGVSAVALQDISGLRKTQEALKNQKADLSLVLDAIPAMTLM